MAEKAVPTIECFYAAHSSYAHLGMAELYRIASKAGRRVEHRPMDLAAVMAAAGSSSFRERTDRHRAYFFERELQRWSEFRGVPILGRPTHHQNDITLANCILIAAIDAGGVDALATAFLTAHWRDDADLADRDTLAALITGQGLDADALLGAAASDQTRERYAGNTRLAIERSVFGSPTYFVDGDMFYGQDRLAMVERALVTPFRRGWSPG